MKKEEQEIIVSLMGLISILNDLEKRVEALEQQQNTIDCGTFD